MFEEQRKERVDDGFEKDQMAMLEKIRNRFSEKKIDSLTGMPL